MAGAPRPRLLGTDGAAIYITPWAESMLRFAHFAYGLPRCAMSASFQEFRSF